MRFIHIRGTNGVGKTTSVKCLINSHSAETKKTLVKGKEYPYVYCADIDAVVCGVYDERTCGGIDGFITNKTELQDYIISILKNVRPAVVIMDSLIYGKTFTFGMALKSVVERFGYKYIGLAFCPSPEKAVERVLGRNGGKEFDVGNLLSGYNCVVYSSKKMKAAGADIRFIDTGKYRLEEMGTILEEAL